MANGGQELDQAIKRTTWNINGLGNKEQKPNKSLAKSLK
jgi:hypothetical protein